MKYETGDGHSKIRSNSREAPILHLFAAEGARNAQHVPSDLSGANVRPCIIDPYLRNASEGLCTGTHACNGIWSRVEERGKERRNVPRQVLYGVWENIY